MVILLITHRFCNRRTKELIHIKARRRTIHAGWDIFTRKGNTCYGIGASVTAIAKSILLDEKSIMPVSVRVDGMYGLNGTFLSVPAILDHTGVKEIVEIDLQEDALAALHKSAELLRTFYGKLDA